MRACLVALICALVLASPVVGWGRNSTDLGPKTLVGPSGWLEIHTCQHREEPEVRGSNIIATFDNDELEPLTAVDDPFSHFHAVFTRGYDQQLWGRWQVSTREGWADWETFGSPNNNAGIRDIPAALSNVNSMITVFAIAVDGQIYARQQYQPEGEITGFTNWTLIGSQLSADVAVNTNSLVTIKTGDGRMAVYVDADGFIYETKETSPGSFRWTEWQRVFGDRRVKSKVAVGYNQFTNLLEAFAILDDNCLYQAWQSREEVWREWHELWECWSQPKFDSNPVVHTMTGSVFNGYLELFVRGVNNQLWHTWQTTCSGLENPWSFCTWGAYYTIAGNMPSRQDGVYLDLEVGSNIHGGLEVFVTGADGNLYHTWQTAMWEDWSDWEDLGAPERGKLTSQPTVVHDRSGWWMAYARGYDGDLEIFVQQKQLTANPRSVQYGEAVQLNWIVPRNEACEDDWIGVYDPQAENDQFLAFVFVNGELNPGNQPIPQGSYNYPLYLPAGYYEFRYLVNRKPNDVLRALIKISGESDLSPQEQLFSGMTIGLGEKAWNFENCTDNLMETFDIFRASFAAFDEGDYYKALQLLGEGIEDYGESMAICGDTSIARAIDKFAKDLRSCIFGACAKFVISVVAEVIIVYIRIHEIAMDIIAADNNMQIGAYEQAGVHIGDMIRSVIQVRH